MATADRVAAGEGVLDVIEELDAVARGVCSVDGGAERTHGDLTVEVELERPTPYFRGLARRAPAS
jgi:hypothetical protein